MKYLILGGMLLAIVIVAAAILAPSRESNVDPCEDRRTGATSPGGGYKAELTVHTCAWGFGQAAETVDLKVTKMGANGWFTHVPIEYDSTAEDLGTEAPTIQWLGPAELGVKVSSKVRVGTIVSKQLGLTISRTYGLP